MIADGLTKKLDDMQPLRDVANGFWTVTGKCAIAPALEAAFLECDFLVICETIG